MILTRSTRLTQPTGPVEPIGTWAAVSVPGVWLDGDANPVESASGNVVFRDRTVGGLATTISSSGAYVSYGANAQMQLSSSSGVIAFVAPSFATQSSLFSTNLANTQTTNAFYVAAHSTGCVIDKANAVGIIKTTNAPLVGRLNVLAWRYNNATGDAALALNGVLTKATSAQTFTHGTVARGRFRLTDTVQAGTHNQLLFAITPRQIGDAELLALSRNPWQLFRPVQRRVYFDMGAGGGATGELILAAGNASQLNSGGTGSIELTHELAGSASSQDNAGSAGAMDQALVLVGASSVQDNSGSTASLSEVQVSLTGAASAQANAASAGAISQSINLQGGSDIQANTGLVDAIVQAYVLGGASSAQSNLGSTGQIILGDLPEVTEIIGASRVRVGPAQMASAAPRVGAPSLPVAQPRIGTTTLSTRRPGRMTI